MTLREDVNSPAAPKKTKPSTTTFQPGSPLRLNHQVGMAYKRLGKTNLMMSRMAMGCASITKANAEIVRTAVDRGVNFLDTAPNYGESETALAEVLPDVRDRIWVCTKTPPLDATLPSECGPERDGALVRAFWENLDASLARLKVDRIDCYMIQAVEKPETACNESLRGAIRHAKDKGKIAFAGLSTHRNVKGVAESALNADFYDVLFLPLNPLNLSTMLPLLDQARFKDVGVIGMKTTIALSDDARVELNELPPDLNPHQLTYLYMLRNCPYAGCLANLDSLELIEKNLHLPDMTLGVAEGNELDAVVYETLWPVCSVCGQQKSISDRNLEEANEAQFRLYDRVGSAPPSNSWRVCEECEGAGAGKES